MLIRQSSLLNLQDAIIRRQAYPKIVIVSNLSNHQMVVSHEPALRLSRLSTPNGITYYCTAISRTLLYSSARP